MPTSSVDILVPLPSFISSTGTRLSVTIVITETWGTSSGQLTSARSGIELTTEGTTVSPSSLCPVNVSYPLTVNGVPSTTILSVLATPFLPSCVPMIGMLPCVPFQTHKWRSCNRTSRCLASETTINPQSVSMQTCYLLRQQLPPISKFSGEGLEVMEKLSSNGWNNLSYVVTDMCDWNDQPKLVNLTTCLRGQA